MLRMITAPISFLVRLLGASIAFVVAGIILKALSGDPTEIKVDCCGWRIRIDRSES